MSNSSSKNYLSKIVFFVTTIAITFVGVLVLFFFWSRAMPGHAADSFLLVRIEKMSMEAISSSLNTQEKLGEGQGDLGENDKMCTALFFYEPTKTKNCLATVFIIPSNATHLNLLVEDVEKDDNKMQVGNTLTAGESNTPGDEEVAAGKTLDSTNKEGERPAKIDVQKNTNEAEENSVLANNGSLGNKNTPAGESNTPGGEQVATGGTPSIDGTKKEGEGLAKIDGQENTNEDEESSVLANNGSLGNKNTPAGESNTPGDEEVAPGDKTPSALSDMLPDNTSNTPGGQDAVANDAVSDKEKDQLSTEDQA